MDQARTMQLDPRESPLVLDRYRLDRRLGAGGFGTVWLAHDERLDRPVAVKRVPLEGGENPRAEREALAAARLAHPGIVSLYEAGHDDDAFYLVSELVRGHTLGELERDGALSDLDVVRIGIALCGALEHAHARGVIHRDVKPGNVMVPEVAEDGAGAAKLTDFGIARLADAADLTRTGDVIGTIAYMAPEQAEGRRVTPAADLYALALVLYEALSGSNPVRAEGAAATARRVGMRLPRLSRVRADLPRDLCAAIDAALDPDPEARGGVSGLRAALAAAEPLVDDDPGLVERDVVEAPAGRTPRWRDEEPHPSPRARDPWSGEEDAWRPARSSTAIDPAPPPRGGFGPFAERATLPGRLLAGIAAGSLAGWALETLPLTVASGGMLPAVDALPTAAAVGGLVALLPRLAWLAAFAAVLAGLGAGRAAVAVAAAGVPVLLLVPRRGTLWSLPAAAPALDAIGLAGIHPALAGQAPRPFERIALGAVGSWWLAVAAIVTDSRPDLTVLAEPGVLALAGLWGAAAGVLPVLVRGRRLAVDAAAAGVWAVALTMATTAIADALAFAEPRNTAVAAGLAALLAIGAGAFRGAAD